MTTLRLCLVAVLLGAVATPTARADRAAGSFQAQVEALLAADRIGEAVTLLENELRERPGQRTLRLLLAEAHRDRCALDASAAHYDLLLAQNALDAEARAGKAELLLMQAKAHEALAQLEAVRRTADGRHSAAVRRVEAAAYVDLGRYDDALRSAREALHLDDEDPLAWEALGRAAFRAGDMKTSRHAYQRVVALDPLNEEANLRLGSGFGPKDTSRLWMSARDRDLFTQATAHWDAGRLAEAAAGYRTLCDRAPTHFKYRFLLGVVRRNIREQGEVGFGPLDRTVYLSQPAPRIPELERFLHRWDRLPRWTQQVVRISVAPARAWLPRLLRVRASHEILRFADSLDDARWRRHLSNTRTFDGRLYAHLRGVGGRQAATGIEKLHAAAMFGFNTFAHEFAHQLLQHGLPGTLRREVNALYQRAKRSGRTLDYYAASNVDEYFAQGYEALVSHVKRGCQRDTARHTRQELKDRDPELHAFFLRTMDLSHETPEALATFRQRLP